MSSKVVVYVEVSGRAGGSNSSLRAILAGLDRARYRPIVVLGDTGNKALWNEETYEVKFASLDNFDFFPAGWELRWLFHFAKFIMCFPADLLRSRQLLIRLKPSVVHINVGQAVAFGVASRMRGIPLVWHVRELVSRNALGAMQDWLYAACAAKVIATSQAVAKRLPACSDNLVVLPNSVAPPVANRNRLMEFRDQNGLREGDFVVLLLAHSLLVSKGYMFLAEVADRLKDQPRIKFLMAGHNVDVPAPVLHRLFRRVYRLTRGQQGEKQRIVERWQGHVEAGRASFPGYVDAPVAISVCSLIVCPNRISEPFGRSVIEGSVYEKPVIAMDLPAFNELIVDGGSGWLLPPSADAWAKTILSLAHDRALVQRAGVIARRRFEELTPERHALALMNLYDTVTACE